MAKVLVLGAGLMGPAIASDLLKYGIAERVMVADIDPERVGEVVRCLGPERCQGMVLDVWDRQALVDAMRQVEVVAGAYPAAAVAQVTEAAIEAGVSLADLTGSAEGFDIFAYHQRAVTAGVTLLPGCGVAPGLTNVLVGQGAARFDRVSEGVIYVGGLPLHPRPPLGYRVVFSMDALIDEYVVPALVIKEGRVVEVPALDGLEEVAFPDPVGVCEAFYTDGLGTMVRTGMQMGFRELAEKTVRYPGHRDKVAFLRDCGFFSREPVRVDGVEVVPRRFTGALLGSLLEQGDEADVTVLRVVVRGESQGKRGTWTFDMVDFYDHDNRVTSMARTTGYTCSILVGMLLRGRIAGPGVVPLEQVFADAAMYEELREELGKRGMRITEQFEEG